MSSAEQWLTLAQLVPAWAKELADAIHSPSQLEHDLWQCLHADAINGFLDQCGPSRNGKRLSLGFIDDNDRFQYVSGRLLGTVHFPFRKSGHRIFWARKGMLAFGRRHGAPPLSSWSNATKRKTQPSRSQVKLKRAPDRIVIEAIGWAYDAAEAAVMKPPNTKSCRRPYCPFCNRRDLALADGRFGNSGTPRSSRGAAVRLARQ